MSFLDAASWQMFSCGTKLMAIQLGWARHCKPQALFEGALRYVPFSSKSLPLVFTKVCSKCTEKINNHNVAQLFKTHVSKQKLLDSFLKTYNFRCTFVHESQKVPKRKQNFVWNLHFRQFQLLRVSLSGRLCYFVKRQHFLHMKTFQFSGHLSPRSLMKTILSMS